MTKIQLIVTEQTFHFKLFRFSKYCIPILERLYELVYCKQVFEEPKLFKFLSVWTRHPPNSNSCHCSFICKSFKRDFGM